MRQAILCKYYKQGKGHLMKAHSWLLTITVNNNNKIASFPAKAVFGGKRVIAADNFITFTGKLCLSRVSLHRCLVAKGLLLRTTSSLLLGSCVSAEYPSIGVWWQKGYCCGQLHHFYWEAVSQQSIPPLLVCVWHNEIKVMPSTI